MTKYAITKKGRWGIITPIPRETLKETLNHYCSYTKQGARFMPNPQWANVKLYKEKTGKFPWGLIDKVKKVLSVCNCEYEINGVGLGKMQYWPSPGLRPYQKNAVKSIIDNDGGIIQAPCGSGKTFMGIELIKYYQCSTLVVVPTIDLKKQWEKELQGRINVKVMTNQSLTVRKGNKQVVKEQYKEFVSSLGLIIIDECHHTAASTIYTVTMNASSAITVGLSASPYRDDGETLKVEAALGKITYNIGIRHLIKAGYLCDAEIRYLPLDTMGSDMLGYLDYHEAYQHQIVENKERNNLIMDVVNKHYNMGTILILVSRIEHGQNLYNTLKMKYPKTCYIHGSLKKKDRERYFEQIASGEFSVVIASTIFDEGVNFPHLHYLIMAGGGKSSIKVVQRVGRILRLFDSKKLAVIYDFVDKFKWLKQHYNRRRELLAENFKVVDYDIKQLRLK